VRSRDAERREFLARAAPGACAPVARVFPSDRLTPVVLFQRMRAGGEECFLLESVEGGESVARYTFLGTAPSARFVVRDRAAAVERDGRTVPTGGPPLAALEKLVRREPYAADPSLPPLSSGAVGYLSYDAVGLFEDIPQSHPPEGTMPEALFLLFDAVAAFDHARQRLLLLTTVDRTLGGDGGAEVDAAISRLDGLEGFLTAPDPAGRTRMAGVPCFETAQPRDEFLRGVAAIREAIAAGEVYQAVLSQRWSARLPLDPFDVYRALRSLNPSPYMYYLETREGTVLGSSPEMLVRCRGREVETHPIAGTARRGAYPLEDERLAEALRNDPKERAEHVMLVDLARNDLGRVCRIGSVRVTRYAEVERFSHVQHLVSEVRGELAEGRTAADALAACFPAGTLTGAPKIRAMEIIDSLESTRRGVYGGAVGYLDAAGSCDTAIAIRTAVVENGMCRIQAGAGIVADSVPEKEYAEAESKAGALFSAIDLAREWFAAPDPKPGTRGSRLP
jgi:anthranilate synthase component 1